MKGFRGLSVFNLNDNGDNQRRRRLRHRYLSEDSDDEWMPISTDDDDINGGDDDNDNDNDNDNDGGGNADEGKLYDSMTLCIDWSTSEEWSSKDTEYYIQFSVIWTIKILLAIKMSNNNTW